MRFQKERGWAKRLADDPVYEQSAILKSDETNTARAGRGQKKRDNNFAMLEGWERLRAGEALSMEGIDHYISLAEFNTNPTGKGGRVSTPVTPARGAGKIPNDCDEAWTSGTLTPSGAIFANQSPTVVRTLT